MAVSERLAKWPGTKQILEVETLLWKSGKEAPSPGHLQYVRKGRLSSISPAPLVEPPKHEK
ncbi:MAG: hypothetical protein LBF49_02710 [Puniceicoccales bacterium]|jgi:hypothetical protein|nr:hypothetical protein [Puniceicoccales bacterium]